MLSAILPPCQSQAQIEEAIAKPIAYAFAPRAGGWGGMAATVAKHWWSSPAVIAHQWSQRQRDKEIAQSFCDAHQITLEWSVSDWRTGFELLVFSWQGRAYIVPIGSNDPLDWRRNLTQHSVGISATQRNRDAILKALEIVGRLEPSEVVVLGHSLGGAIAQYLAAEWTTISRCITFQSAAVPSQIADQTTSTVTVKHYLHPSDPVYPLSRARCQGGLLSGDVIYRGDRVRGFARIQAHLAMLTLLIPA